MLNAYEYSSVVDPDPAFYLNAAPDSGSQTKKWKSIRIRILVRLPSHKKVNFYMEGILKVGSWSKNICTYEGSKDFLDPDPHSNYGSGSTTLVQY
jgi:hypothetical protein